MTGTNCELDCWSVPYPTVPSYVPETAGLWQPGGEYKGMSQRRHWISRNVPTNRVRRLLAVALSSRAIPSYETRHPGDERPRQAALLAEESADYARLPKGFAKQMRWAGEDDYSARGWWADDTCHRSALHAAANAADAVAQSSPDNAAERLNQSRLMSLAVPLASWSDQFRSSVAAGIAETMYRNREWSAGLALADALEEADMENNWLLSLLRDTTFPLIAFRGMWFLDRLRGVGQ